MNIQPSIVARLKPELVPECTEFLNNRNGAVVAAKRRKPMEYRDQILDLQPDEDANSGDTADLGTVIAEVEQLREVVPYRGIGDRTIRVQFHHKIEV